MYQSRIQNTIRPSLSRVRVVRTLSFFVVTCMVMYVGLMIQTVALINERKEIRESVRQTQITISDLEVHYFDLAQSIDTETIKQLGFTEPTVPVFAYTAPAAPTVALSR